VILVFAYLSLCYAAPSYFIGAEGESCYETCYKQNRNCNPHIATNNSLAIFNALGINCQGDTAPWWAEDQPSYVVDPSDPNYQKCVGYIDVPDGVMCGASYPTTRRLCSCDDPNDASKVAAFGTGLSSGAVTTKEQIIFNWILPSTVSHGVMTHFWATAGSGILEKTLVRYYIDGETTPSIQYLPPLACGTADDETHAPWGTQWFGKGAKDGSWFNNFRIPFQRSVRVTVQHLTGTFGGFYIIVRGAPNLAINIGGVNIPSTAKLLLQRFEQTVPPLAWVPVVNVPTGNGLFFMHTLSVVSNNLNFLEGCYHQYSPVNQPFPGTVLSTGTEDYFDSGWYFNAGQFWLPVAGLTHIATTSTTAEVSAYRFHETDPLPFDSGLLIHWRNGDMVDPAGRKCFVQSGGRVVGSPGPSQVTSYGWVYTW
jgi:hypothetical protein